MVITDTMTSGGQRHSGIKSPTWETLMARLKPSVQPGSCPPLPHTPAGLHGCSLSLWRVCYLLQGACSPCWVRLACFLLLKNSGHSARWWFCCHSVSLEVLLWGFIELSCSVKCKALYTCGYWKLLVTNGDKRLCPCPQNADISQRKEVYVGRFRVPL